MVSKKALAASAWRSFGITQHLGLAGRWRGLLVLNYHRIGDGDTTPFDADNFSATEEDFDAHMAFLAHHYEVISLDDLPEARRDPRGRYVMVTFDDGYRDNYSLAFPILRRYRLPATFFIATGFLDDPKLAWWDRIAWTVRGSQLRQLPASEWWGGPYPLTDPASQELATRAVLAAFKRTPGSYTDHFLAALCTAAGIEPPDELGAQSWMTWNHIRELRLAGMSIGGHTHSHPVLGQLSAAEQMEEIKRCKERLLDGAGVRTRAFAYPVGTAGTFTTMTRAILIANGFDLAFSFYGGYQSMTDIDLLDIRRSNVGRYMDQNTFESLVTLPQVFAR